MVWVLNETLVSLQEFFSGIFLLASSDVFLTAYFCVFMQVEIFETLLVWTGFCLRMREDTRTLSHWS